MRSVKFYALLLIVVGGLFALQWFISSRSFAEAKLVSLSSFQEKQLEIFRESDSLLTTLATAAIGAIGAFVFNRYNEGDLPRGQRIRAIASAVLAGISLYCGFLSQRILLWMLQKGFFNLTNPRLVWSDELQFWSFLLSLAVLGEFFYWGLHVGKNAKGKTRVKSLSITGIGILMFCLQFGAKAGYAQVQHTVTLQEDLKATDQVDVAVQRWTEATGVVVTQEARKALKDDLATQQGVLKAAFMKQGLKPPQQTELSHALVDQYLYGFRDRRVSKIDVQDVRAFPPSSFLASMKAVLDNRVGYLDVLSDPDKANIIIDGEQKDELTCRTFVVSPGKHSVRVAQLNTKLNCTEEVTVDPETTKTVTCPKGQKVKCKLPKKTSEDVAQ
jgi:hypothetical protein